jgi:dienelactone hydrolase
MQKRTRLALMVLGLASLVVVVGILSLLRDPLPRMLARHSSLASIEESPSFLDSGYVLTPVRLTAASGLAVDLLLRRAVNDTGRRLPLAMILGGHQTGRKAAQLLGNTRGVLVAALAYPFSGNSRPDAFTFIREIPRIRAAFLDTPPAVMLALDYLWSRPDVDTSQVEAVGVSLGAPFVCIAGALDERFTRVWAIHGSGGSYAPLEANMKRTIPSAPIRAVAATIANVIINGPALDPVRWAPRIAPRPFIMVSAADDERMPRSAVDALYQSAREPKEMIWMSGGHVHRDSATVQRLVEIVMTRMNRDVAAFDRASLPGASDLRRASPASDRVGHRAPSSPTRAPADLESTPR